ncbi:hypothetical protein PNEG_03417 [Pneumocystis murina B123]|uniref:Uncharacterized protein n=1 Tax=Pneumocystis murina (strain B123) TaxID=1069680 RepID=M7P344_PNEMU|nr:hypothetical protein PNEG_03417 [Pneumocystis murina B123]EMR08250.1 hypothetical protein PNEG_03417 [Pneumocystis murina B123]
MKFWTPPQVSKLQDSLQVYRLNKGLSGFISRNDSIWSEISSRIGKTAAQCYLKWKRSLNREIIKGPWTSSEKEIIEEAHKKYGSHWKKISMLVPGRTPEQIEIYFRENRRNHFKSNLRYSPYILDNIDHALSTGLYYMENGKISWTKLSKDRFPNIKPIQLRKAWLRNNTIGFKRRLWTPEDIERLVKAVEFVRSSNLSYQIWKAVAELVPGRTPASCKTKYRYLKFQRPASKIHHWTTVQYLRLINSAVTRQFRWVDVAIDIRQPEALCRTKFHDLLLEKGTISGNLAREAWFERKKT